MIITSSLLVSAVGAPALCDMEQRIVVKTVVAAFVDLIEMVPFAYSKIPSGTRCRSLLFSVSQIVLVESTMYIFGPNSKNCSREVYDTR